MAKINARGARQIGPTLFTERVRPAGHGDVERVYYEAWRLRSDGAVMTRIIRTWPVAEESIGEKTEHRGSTFRIVGKVVKDRPVEHEVLRRYLAAKGYTVVKEQWH
jgi:hypothetical protein